VGPGGASSSAISAWMRLALPSGALLVLAWEWARERARPNAPLTTGRWSRCLLPSLGALSLLTFFNFGAAPTGSVHLWDAFHYVVGAKYFDELGYDGLYDCVAVADARAGLDVARRPLRDLRTGHLSTAGAALAHPEACVDRFSPERWRTFEADVTLFRRRFVPTNWTSLQLDHGFNPSPAWILVAHPLVGGGTLSWTRVRGLCAIDLGLLLAAFGVALWGFGARTTALAAIVLGTYFPAQLTWTNGSFLRWDWFAAALAGVALCRRDRPLAGGAALGYAALARVFPIFALAGVGLAAVAEVVRRRPIDSSVRRALVGAALVACVLAPAATLAHRSHGWRDFAARLSAHAGVASPNRMGLPVVLSFESETELAREPPGESSLSRWEDAQDRTLARRRWSWLAALALGLVALARASAGRPAWVAAALGFAAAPLGPALACYYYAFVAIPALLGGRNRDTAVVVLSLALAAALIGRLPLTMDRQFLAQSALAIVVMVYLLFGAPARAQEPTGTSA
jgi:hypothetical protein